MKNTYHFKLDANAPEIKITYKQRAAKKLSAIKRILLKYITNENNDI